MTHRLRSLLVVMVACSSPPPPSKPPASKPEPQIRAIDLGHYRSADGTIGVTIDRKEKSARIKLDGTTEVIELDAARSTNRTDYLRTINHRMLEIHDDGRVVIYLPQRPQGVELVRDGDVDLVTGAVTIKPNPCCTDTPKVTKDQPPEVKLKLGHWKNDKRGIGLVFDATSKPAKLRFDGTTEIIKLDPIPGTNRIDYAKTLREIVVQQWHDGRMEVWVPNAKTSIRVYRDGDADPL